MPTNAARGGGSSGGGNGGGGGRRTKHRPKSPTDQVRVDREDILFGNGTDTDKGNYAHNGRNDDDENRLFEGKGRNLSESEARVPSTQISTATIAEITIR